MQARPISHQLLFREGDYIAEMCLEKESFDLAYWLRYQAYLAAEAIAPNETKQFTDPFDWQSNARTYLIWYQDKAVASVRSLSWSAAYDWQPLPSVEYFKTAVEKELGLKTPLLESNKYVVDPSFQGRQSLVAQMLMFRIQTLGTIADECQYVITAVRPRHARFYERFMNFYTIADAIEVPDVQFPIQLMVTPAGSREKLAQSNAIAAYKEEDLGCYQQCLEQLKAQLK